eukprot:Clim_evm6s172 gene=Clim_evmTU6s172
MTEVDRVQSTVDHHADGATTSSSWLFNPFRPGALWGSGEKSKLSRYLQEIECEIGKDFETLEKEYEAEDKALAERLQLYSDYARHLEEDLEREFTEEKALLQRRLQEADAALRERLSTHHLQSDKHSHLNVNWRVHVISGAAAGTITAIATSPLDVVKTRLQITNHPSIAQDGQQGIKVVKTLRDILKNEGIRGWYRGLGPTLMGLLPNWAIYFPAYEEYKAYTHDITGLPISSPFVHITAAMGAGITCAIATNPLWVVKTRMMTQHAASAHQYEHTAHAFATILRTEGIAGLYRGLTPSLLGVGHVAIQFPAYEQMKELLRDPSRPEPQGLTKIDIVIAAAVSKVVASTLWYPHEVVRTRMQNQTETPLKYKNLLQTARLILHEEGFQAFYRGMGTNLLRVTPAGALTFLSYETFRDYLTNNPIPGVTIPKPRG